MQGAIKAKGTKAGSGSRTKRSMTIMFRDMLPAGILPAVLVFMVCMATCAGSARAADYDTLSGSISSSTDGDDTYGLYAYGDDLTVNILSGSVAATAGGNQAYGLRTNNGDLTVTDLSGSVAATAGGNTAYGLYGDYNLTVTDLSGSVAATAGGNTAYGLKTNNGDLTVTDLSGSVAATAGGSYAYGLYGEDNLTVTTLSGSVSATADGSRAYGLYTDKGDLTVTDLSGSVSATAGGNEAYGFFTELTYDLTMNTLSGSVSATAGGNQAYGVLSRSELTMTDLSGSVSATAGGNIAFGLSGWSGITLDTLSGSVSATADGYGAFGLYAGLPLQNSSGGATEISGSVIAEAKGLAVAVSAGTGMKLYVTGTLSATDTSGAGNAYAIASGNASGSTWVVGGAYDDTVTLGSGASVTGDIDLGGGTNTLTLEDAGTLIGDITNITTMTKNGSGAWSTGSISTGDLTVDEGTLNVEVSQTASPTVTATGTVTNNGVINFSLGDSIAAGNFTALTSAALAGTGTYTTDSVFLTAAVNGNNVDLTKESFTDVFAGASGTTSQLAAALDANYATANGELADLILALEQSSTLAEAEAAMAQINTLLLTQNMDLSISAARFQSLATQSRMAEMRTYHRMLAQKDEIDPDDQATWPMLAAVGDLSGLLSRSQEESPNGLYLRVVGRTGSMDNYAGQTGYDFRTVLLSGGYDRVVGDNFLLGVSAGYAATGTDYDDAGGSTSVLHSYNLGVYGSWFAGGWYLDGLLSGTYNQYDMERELPVLGATAEADPTGYALSAKAETGHRFETGAWGLTPMASLEYTRFHQQGYTETGAGAANLIIGDVDSNFLESGLGGKIDRTWIADFGRVVPELSAMWLHEWMTQDKEITYSMTGLPGTVFSQATAEADNDVLRLGAGARFMLDNGLNLTTRYVGKMAEHSRSHSLLLEAMYTF